MSNMKGILEGIAVDEMLEQINHNPDFWDKYPLRTQGEFSPHRECHDIWLRFRDWFEYDGDPAAFCNSPHPSVWYPEIARLPAVKATIQRIFDAVDGAALGGCLITKVPAGKQVYPHADFGFNCEHYLSKYLLILQSAPGQQFCFDGESHDGRAGELFLFDNRAKHWVANPTDTDRISLILSIRQQGQESAYVQH